MSLTYEEKLYLKWQISEKQKKRAKMDAKLFPDLKIKTSAKTQTFEEFLTTVSSYTCKWDDCDVVVNTNKGMGAYCETHRFEYIRQRRLSDPNYGRKGKRTTGPVIVKPPQEVINSSWIGEIRDKIQLAMDRVIQAEQELLQSKIDLHAILSEALELTR